MESSSSNSDWRSDDEPWDETDTMKPSWLALAKQKPNLKVRTCNACDQTYIWNHTVRVTGGYRCLRCHAVGFNDEAWQAVKILLELKHGSWEGTPNEAESTSSASSETRGRSPSTTDGLTGDTDSNSGPSKAAPHKKIRIILKRRAEAPKKSKIEKVAKTTKRAKAPKPQPVQPVQPLRRSSRVPKGKKKDSSTED